MTGAAPDPQTFTVGTANVSVRNRSSNPKCILANESRGKETEDCFLRIGEHCSNRHQATKDIIPARVRRETVDDKAELLASVNQHIHLVNSRTRVEISGIPAQFDPCNLIPPKSMMAD